MPNAHPKMASHAMEAFGASVLLVILVGSRLQLLNIDFGLIITELLFIAAPAAIVLAIHWNAIPPGVFSPPKPRPALLSLAIGLCAVLVSIYKGVNVRRAVLGIDPTAMDPLRDLSINFFILALLAPVSEELLFRPVIQNALGRHFSPRGSAVYTAFLFALFHLNLLRFPETLIIGIFASIVFLRTGNFWCPVLVHLVCNGLGPILWRNYAAISAYLSPFTVIGVSSLAILCAGYLGVPPPQPLSGLRQRLRWALFGAPSTEKLPMPACLRVSLVVIPLLMAGLIGYGFALSKRAMNTTSDYVVDQTDTWTMESPDLFRVSSELVLKKVPAAPQDLVIFLYNKGATVESVMHRQEALDCKKTAGMVYRIAPPAQRPFAVGDTVTVVWTVPTDSLEPAQPGYKTPLTTLAPSQSFSLTVKLEDACGHSYVKNPKAREIILFHGLSDTPKRTYGLLRIGLQPTHNSPR